MMTNTAQTFIQYEGEGCSIRHSFSNAAIDTRLFSQEHQLLFVLQGSIFLRYGDEQRNVSSGHVLFLRRSTCVELTGAGGASYITFAIGESLLREFTRMASFDDRCDAVCPYMVNDTSDTIRKYLEHLTYYFSRPGATSDSLMRLKVLELLFCLMEESKPLVGCLLQWKQQICTDIVTVVNEHIESSATLSSLARLSGRSLSSFKRDFQAIYNMPPHRWIRMKRLEKARDMVSSTSLPVTDVCYLLGFNSAAHFSRLFKSHFGVTATDFRRLQRSDA